MRSGIVAGIVVALGAAMPVAATAQDFGVLNSAETINQGNVKLLVNPIVIIGEGAADNEIGVGVMGGYGFTDRFDVEVKAAFYEAINFFGADAEYWLVRDSPVDVSVIGGLHVGRGDFDFDTTGVDLTLLFSGHTTPRLELYGALDVALNSIDGRTEDFTTGHLVPGLEYAIAPAIDLVAELGIGLNDDSATYVSGGIAFYVR